MMLFNFSTCAVSNDSLYVISTIDESLYRISLNSFVPVLVTDDQCFVSNNNDLAHKIFVQGNNIIKWCVGSRTGYIKIHNIIENCTKEVKFFDGQKTLIIPHENKIVALCIDNGMIEEYDLLENRITYVSRDVSYEICNISVNPSFYYVFDNMRYAYFLSKNTNCIYKLDIIERCMKLEQLSSIYGNIELIGYESNVLYFYTDQGSLYIYEDGEAKCIAEGIGLGKYMFSSILPTKNTLVLIPYRGSDIVIVDKITGKISIYDDMPKDIIFNNKNYKFFDACIANNAYYVAMPTSNYFIKVTYEGMITWHEPIIQRSDLISIILKKDMIVENNEIDLETFILNI